MPSAQDSASKFSATASLIGYLYQVRHALLEAIELYRRDPQGVIAIERGDDVELVQGTNRYLQQLKHRAAGVRIGDKSTDLWKTLRIWSQIVAEQPDRLEHLNFRLITTAEITSGSAVSMLTADIGTRDVELALETLRGMAMLGGNDANKKAYEAFLNLETELQHALLTKLQILSESNSIGDTRTELESILSIGLSPDRIKSFTNDLEGWWLEACIRSFESPVPSFIEVAQVNAQIKSLRDSYADDDLPIHPEIAALTANPDRYARHRFVSQLQQIQINERRINRAITNYLRAFTQRAHWQRTNLLSLDDLRDYERVLREEWALHFDQLEDDIGTEASDEARMSMARELYKWAEGTTEPTIRDKCTEPFVVRGSLHILANTEGRRGVYWHPALADSLKVVVASLEDGKS